MKMTLRACWRPALLVALSSAFAPRLAAQRPAESQIRDALQNNPNLANTARERLRASGLSQEEVRSRLQQAGYSSNLLDQFFTEATPGDTTRPDQGQLEALAALGLIPASAQRPILGQSSPGVNGSVGQPTLAAPRSRYFGVDVFRRTTTQFFPLFTGPVPPDYRLGAGDVPVIILTGDVEQVIPAPVTREGYVVIPRVGQVNLSNLTVSQARTLVEQRMKRVYSGIGDGPNAGTHFDFTVSNVRAVTVYVVGEVAQPGAYQLSAMSTVLTALYAAGGPDSTGDLRNIEVRRGGKVVATFDLYDYVVNGDTRNATRVDDGDVVNVATRKSKVIVAGRVVRPSIYNVRASETLRDVIRFAGGLTADAAGTRITIHRIVPTNAQRPGEAQRIVVDAMLIPGAPRDSMVPTVPIFNGDSITVVGLDDSRRGFVDVAGSVYSPGRFGYEPGLRLSVLAERAGGFTPGTFRGIAHIARLNPADSTRSLIRVALPDDSLSPWPQDLALEDGDEVTFYNRADMRAATTVSIAGVVNHGGKFPWREGMTLRDLVLIAGGLRAGASLDSAEVASLPTDRSRGQLATVFSVPLDSTYVFDRDSLGRAMSPVGTAFRGHGAPDYVLKPFDHVLILQQPEFELQRTVTVLGAVRRPGTYALTTKGERLDDLITRAGGLTPTAYPEALRYFRLYPPAGRPDTLIPSRINIDLQRTLRDRNSRENLILQPGDSMFIPEFDPVVRVEGAVNNPGPVLWVRGKPLSYYIGAAGGYRQNALSERASVRQPDGTIETRHGRSLGIFGGGDPEPRAGGIVTVPTKVETNNNSNSIAIITALSSIMASTVAVIAVVLRK